MFAYPQELMALTKLRMISCIQQNAASMCNINSGRQLCVSFSNFKVTKRHDKEEKTKSFMVEKYTRDPFARVQITFFFSSILRLIFVFISTQIFMLVMIFSSSTPRD